MNKPNSRVTAATVVAVGGFSSEVGKTTLMCDLLRAFPGWEAIKATRGHYRSCGKDPQTCCVAHLLGDKPLVRSGREQTYTEGKDTGRYWDAGAANVHWVIVTDDQVEQGITEALSRVTAPGVFIEGNSFLDYVAADYTLMVASSDGGKIKKSARRALAYTSAIYVFDKERSRNAAEKFSNCPEFPFYQGLIEGLPVYANQDFPRIVESIESSQGLWSRPTRVVAEGK